MFPKKRGHYICIICVIILIIIGIVFHLHTKENFEDTEPSTLLSCADLAAQLKDENDTGNKFSYKTEWDAAEKANVAKCKITDDFKIGDTYVDEPIIGKSYAIWSPIHKHLIKMDGPNSFKTVHSDDGAIPKNDRESFLFMVTAGNKNINDNTNWKCYGGFSTPMKQMPDGNVACMSSDGKNCRWGQCPNTGGPNDNPLVCGPMHKRVWGGPGYGNTLHWCEKMKKIFEKGPKDAVGLWNIKYKEFIRVGPFDNAGRFWFFPNISTADAGELNPINKNGKPTFYDSWRSENLFINKTGDGKTVSIYGTWHRQFINMWEPWLLPYIRDWGAKPIFSFPEKKNPEKEGVLPANSYWGKFVFINSDFEGEIKTDNTKTTDH